MAHSLKKGQKHGLEKGLNTVRIEFGWKPNPKGQVKFDGDVSAHALADFSGGRKWVNDEDGPCFYHNKVAMGGIMVLDKDNQDGQGQEGKPDETLIIKLSELPQDVVEVALLLSIDKRKMRRQDWSNRNAFCVIYDRDAGEELTNFRMDGEDYAGIHVVQPGSFYRTGSGGWDFEAMGTAFNIDQIAKEAGKTYDLDLEPFWERWGH